MQCQWRRFDELGRDELYAMLALRQSILIVEQASPYPDLDFVDQVADHLLATDNGVLVGYARCHAPLTETSHASFGRVVVAQSHRRTGLGKELVRRAIARIAEGLCRDIRIGAQLYLEDFYARFGFARDGEPYDDAGVPHVDMRLRLEPLPFEKDRITTALRASWSIATSGQWLAENPARGQCNVTALLIKELFGGEILKTPLPEGDHFYNRIDGARIDLTESQFKTSVRYRDIASDPGEALAGTSAAKYAALKAAFSRNFK